MLWSAENASLADRDEVRSPLDGGGLHLPKMNGNLPQMRGLTVIIGRYVW